jgi:shikimate kinase
MKRIILVGFMGCGKSTLGKKIAARLNVPFIDSDFEIQKHYNKSIGEIFAEQGESQFREIEKEYIQTLDLKEDFVLATGGGMPCFGNNMELLNGVGTTFYMERSAKELTHRLVNAKKQRPLITGMSEEELLSFVEDRLILREEYYKKAAVVLPRDEQNPDAIQNYLNHFLTDFHQRS